MTAGAPLAVLPVVRFSAFARASAPDVLGPFALDLEAFAHKMTTFRVRPDIPAGIEADRDLVRAGRATGFLAAKVAEHGVKYVLDALPRWWKSRLPAWSPAVYDRGAKRSALAVRELSCLVVDVDRGAPLDAVWGLWSEHARILHTSWSHSEHKTKCRLVVPLAEPIPAVGWERTWAWAADYAIRRGVEPDKQCKNLDRIYFAPAVPAEDHPREARAVLDAPLLNVAWRELPDPRAIRERQARDRAPLVLRPGERPPAYATPDARLELAARLNVTVRDGEGGKRAVRAVCPSCGRSSVWFWIHPDLATSATCDHRRSCGWSGPLHELDHR